MIRNVLMLNFIYLTCLGSDLAPQYTNDSSSVRLQIKNESPFDLVAHIEGVGVEKINNINKNPYKLKTGKFVIEQNKSKLITLTFQSGTTYYQLYTSALIIRVRNNVIDKEGDITTETYLPNPFAVKDIQSINIFGCTINNENKLGISVNL